MAMTEHRTVHPIKVTGNLICIGLLISKALRYRVC